MNTPLTQTASFKPVTQWVGGEEAIVASASQIKTQKI